MKLSPIGAADPFSCKFASLHRRFDGMRCLDAGPNKSANAHSQRLGGLL
jgi:hypothetical protein